MKNILISIRLYYFYCTCKGIKTKEIRKKFPLNYKGKIYEYVSKTNWKQDLMKIPAEEREFFKQFVGKVGLCFECDKVDEFYDFDDDLCKQACLDRGEMLEYLGDKKGYAIHITKLEIFDKPKEISEFSIKGEYTCSKSGCPYFATDKCRYASECLYEKPLTRAPESYCYIDI